MICCSTNHMHYTWNGLPGSSGCVNKKDIHSLVLKTQLRNMKVEVFNNDHLDAVTNLHMWAFKDHLNILLGKRYIRAFLKWFIQQENCVNVVGTDEEGNAAGAKNGQMATII